MVRGSATAIQKWMSASVRDGSTSGPALQGVEPLATVGYPHVDLLQCGCFSCAYTASATLPNSAFGSLAERA
jgi:hypothetical protein